ncbi:hypothetical protein [Tranquillimonas alkanivorans]|uniref:Helix-turn-helix domain-containing protein n=1 Tax=Tranquillimonas alkanivorans TaxID=441119 RepID=A0A1I5PMJ2_9RHOB|nr:hypothetical protein [Tranquillimonas alkanivorans]SFP35342.1 hypothetical protein SAMN04488047_105174 [Tranquillimonas alkanivorans]
MSFRVRELVEERAIGKASKASAAARKCVLLAMADRADAGGDDIYLSRNTLSELTEQSTSTVKNVLASLRKDGLIARTGTRPCRGGHTVNYRIDLEKLQSLPLNAIGRHRLEKASATDQEGRRLPPPKRMDEPAKGAGGHPLVGRRLATGGPEVAPKPSINHPLTVHSQRKRDDSSAVNSARGHHCGADHLSGDAEFEEWVEEERRRALSEAREDFEALDDPTDARAWG